MTEQRDGVALPSWAPGLDGQLSSTALSSRSMRTAPSPARVTQALAWPSASCSLPGILSSEPAPCPAQPLPVWPAQRSPQAGTGSPGRMPLASPWWHATSEALQPALQTCLQRRWQWGPGTSSSALLPLCHPLRRLPASCSLPPCFPKPATPPPLQPKPPCLQRLVLPGIARLLVAPKQGDCPAT